MSGNADADLREEVRSRYAAAARAVMEPKSGASDAPGAPAGCCDGTQASSCCGTEPDSDPADVFGTLYGEGETDELPKEAVLASLGCGNPVAVAGLNEGERVLDLRTGGGARPRWAER